MAESKKLWERFDEDVKNLGGELRRHYKGSGDDKGAAEVNQSLERLRQAADSVFKSIETASRDPEIRTSAKQAAQSFGTAIAQTLRELGDEIDRAVRRPAQKK
jgi:archaellum component FlaC